MGLHTEAEGTGKGFWGRTLNHLYGMHAMQVQNPDHVTGKHNTHLEQLLRLTADEALFALDPRHRNALYNLITEPRITIEPKFIDAYTADNHLNIDVISNAQHFLPVSGRRGGCSCRPCRRSAPAITSTSARSRRSCTTAATRRCSIICSTRSTSRDFNVRAYRRPRRLQSRRRIHARALTCWSRCLQRGRRAVPASEMAGV